MEVASKRNILVAGVARNCETTIKREVIQLSNALRVCEELHWFIVESDSTDNTVSVLRDLEGEIPDFRFVALGALRGDLPSRTERIAHCRNVYLDELRSNPLYSDVTYVVIADLDGVNDLLSPSGFDSCWANTDWDVCTANQRGPYYDIWALRHDLWSPNDCGKQYQFLIDHNVAERVAAWTACLTRMITIGETENWIEVESAFGGLAIYRRQTLDGVRYIGSGLDGEPVCEHVPLHEQVRSNGYKILINPRLINTGESIHCREALQEHWLERRERRVLRKVKGTVKAALARLRPNQKSDIK